MATAEELVEVISPSAAALGFELVRVQITGDKNPTLQIMAERPDGTMSIDDCAALSRAVSAVLDVEDRIKGHYLLEVSSPGIDRPLTRLKDFARFAGFEARFTLRNPRAGQRRFRGVLGEIEGEKILFKTESEAIWVPFQDIEKAQLILTDALVTASLKVEREFK